jgi:hypothetical protein
MGPITEIWHMQVKHMHVSSLANTTSPRCAPLPELSGAARCVKANINTIDRVITAKLSIFIG